jgi:hypothetical protein
LACWLKEEPAEAWLQATRLAKKIAIATRERRFIDVLLSVKNKQISICIFGEYTIK